MAAIHEAWVDAERYFFNTKKACHSFANDPEGGKGDWEEDVHPDGAKLAQNLYDALRESRGAIHTAAWFLVKELPTVQGRIVPSQLFGHYRDWAFWLVANVPEVAEMHGLTEADFPKTGYKSHSDGPKAG